MSRPACTQWIGRVRPSRRSCSTKRTVSSNTKSRLPLTPCRSMRRTSICSARANRSVSPTRHSDTTASTPSGSDCSADVAEPDTVVVGMSGGYTQFVTAVAEVEAIGRASAVIAATSSMRSRVRIPAGRAACDASPLERRCPVCSAEQSAAIGPDVLQADSTSTPVRTAWRIAKHHSTQVSPFRLVARGLSRDPYPFRGFEPYPAHVRVFRADA